MTTEKKKFKSVREFLSRLIYTYRLVWDSGRGSLLLMLFISIIEGCLPVISAILSKNILNELQFLIQNPLEQTDFGTLLKTQLVFWLIFFFVFKILGNLIGRINSTVMRLVGERLIAHIKLLIMNQTQEIDLSEFDTPAFFEKLENADREAGSRPVTILHSSFTMLSTIISLASYFIVLSIAMPLAAICMIVVSIPAALINFTYRKKLFEYIKYNSRNRREMNYYSSVLVNKDLVKEIKIFSLSKYFITKYKEVFERYFKGLKRLIVKENLLYTMITVISSLTSCAFFALIAYQVIVGKIMIGDYTLLTGSLTSIAANVSSMIMLSASIYEGTLFIDNLMSFLDEKSKIKETCRQKRHISPGQAHRIEFVGVSFRYPEADSYVLKDVNVVFAPEELTMIVGLNGAGKTTLIKLMTRLYDPTEGVILLDGYDLRDYYVEDLYRLYGAIFQDFGKYAVSVADNVRFGNLSREDGEEALTDSVQKAGAEEFVNRLPKGYDTQLMRVFEKSGTEPSIGQWQKIAIARAYYAGSDILILDEPTASLDPLAEQEIYNQFESLRKGKTTIFVSHRLSSATVASKIIVMREGQIVEQGTHAELMAAEGEYFALFTTQARRYAQKGTDVDT